MAIVDCGQMADGPAALWLAAIVRSGASLAQEWGQEPEQVRLIPSGGLALALDPDLQARILLQEIQRQAAQNGEVLRTMVDAHPAVILPEGNVQHPVEAVLDLPVRPGCSQRLLGLPGQSWRGSSASPWSVHPPVAAPPAPR